MSGFEWGKITTVALAVTAVSGATAAVSGGIPKPIGAFTSGDAGNETARSEPAPPETKNCPDGSIIPVAEQCARIVDPFPGPFLVFFDWDKAEITPSAAAILDNVAVGSQERGQLGVALAGHADRSGSDEYNFSLSQRRANAVRAYLAARGVPDAAITSQAYGESRPLLDTADDVREPRNRRVEITLGFDSNR